MNPEHKKQANALIRAGDMGLLTPEDVCLAILAVGEELDLPGKAKAALETAERGHVWDPIVFGVHDDKRVAERSVKWTSAYANEGDRHWFRRALSRLASPLATASFIATEGNESVADSFESSLRLKDQLGVRLTFNIPWELDDGNFAIVAWRGSRIPAHDAKEMPAWAFNPMWEALKKDVESKAAETAEGGAFYDPGPLWVRATHIILDVVLPAKVERRLRERADSRKYGA